jgi:hypothetical protein
MLQFLGFHSKCTKRAMKTGGTIRIAGVCPSRIIVNILENGKFNNFRINK